jgi:hypothetical protein
MSARSRSGLRALLYAAVVCAAACSRQDAPHAARAPTSAAEAAGTGAGNVAPTSDAAPATSVGRDAVAVTCLPSHDGYLRLRMRGDTNMDIDWRDADMLCDGGPRPGQQGIRLTFAGPGRRGAHSLRFVFGIATGPGMHIAHNVPTNVTVIFEGERKLYSTAGDSKCTVDELTEQPLAAQGSARLHRISARGFCTAPATAIAGKAALLLSRFDFVGPVAGEDPADDPSKP